MKRLAPIIKESFRIIGWYGLRLGKWWGKKAKWAQKREGPIITRQEKGQVAVFRTA